MENFLDKRTITGALVGNVMEFYDWVIYGYLSIYISKNFFPSDNQIISLLMTFGVFASGYLTRPLGSILFGHIGDKFGRRLALLYSILVITIATFLIGLLPTYKDIGILAPCFLLTLRLLQGLAVSGEEGGAVVYLAEMFQMKRNSLVSAGVFSSVFLGVLLGSIAALLSTLILSEQQMYAWGWRLPFLASIILGLLSLKMRLASSESPVFKKLLNNNQVKKIPLISLLKENPLNLLKMFLLSASFAIPSSLFCTYLPTFYAKNPAFGASLGLLLSTFGVLWVCIMIPLIGILAEKMGTQKIVKIGCLLLLIFGYPIFQLWNEQSIIAAILVEILFGFILAVISAPMFAIIFEAFPAEVSCTGVSLAFNTGMALFASTTPMLVIAAPVWLGITNFAGLYLALSSLGGLMVLKLTGVKFQSTNLKVYSNSRI